MQFQIHILFNSGFFLCISSHPWLQGIKFTISSSPKIFSTFNLALIAWNSKDFIGWIVWLWKYDRHTVWLIENSKLCLDWSKILNIDIQSYWELLNKQKVEYDLQNMSNCWPQKHSSKTHFCSGLPTYIIDSTLYILIKKYIKNYVINKIEKRYFHRWIGVSIDDCWC